MKCLFLFLFIVLFCPQTKSYADNVYFAQIINPDTYLYRDLNKNIICSLPETYFVKVSSYSNGFYTASYNGINGYIKSNEVKVISGAPKKPFLTDATFRLFASDYATLKSAPSMLSHDITSLPINEPLSYIGKTYGSELISGRGNVWYYCSYTQNNQNVNGYVYAGLCDNLDINYNTELVDFIPNPFTSISTEYIEYLNSKGGKQTVILSVTFISSIFAFLIFLPLIVKNHKIKPPSIYNIEDGKI